MLGCGSSLQQFRAEAPVICVSVTTCAELVPYDIHVQGSQLPAPGRFQAAQFAQDPAKRLGSLVHRSRLHFRATSAAAMCWNPGLLLCLHLQH